jgi:uncharacterized protein (DUF736 family)
VPRVPQFENQPDTVSGTTKGRTVSEFDNNMRGVLFPNEKATAENKQPTHRGNCEIDGKEYEIAGWRKTTQAGKPMMSLKFSEKKEEQAESKRAKPARSEADEFF